MLEINLLSPAYKRQYLQRVLLRKIIIAMLISIVFSLLLNTLLTNLISKEQDASEILNQQLTASNEKVAQLKSLQLETTSLALKVNWFDGLLTEQQSVATYLTSLSQISDAQFNITRLYQLEKEIVVIGQTKNQGSLLKLQKIFSPAKITFLKNTVDGLLAFQMRLEKPNKLTLFLTKTTDTYAA